MTLKIKNIFLFAAGMTALAIFLVSCGGQGPPPKQDISPPIVIKTIPADGNTDFPNGFPLTGTIQIEFDGAMAPATINAKTIVVTSGTGSIAGSVLYGNNSAFFAPDQPLLENTQYTVTVNAMAADASGNHMGRDNYFLFTTLRLPSVQSTNPQNGDAGIVVNQSISITLSKRVDPSTLNFSLISTETVSYDLYINTDLTNYTVVPHATVDGLAGNTHYTATVSAGLKDLFGNTMQQDYVWGFTTGPSRDIAPPTVQVTDPVNGALDVSVTPQITVIFDEQLSTSTTPTLTLFTAGTNSILCQRLPYPISDQKNHQFVLPPAVTLNYFKRYTATISAGLKDVAVPPNVTTAPSSWTFTTVKASTTTSVSVPATVPYGNDVGVMVTVLSSTGTPTTGFVTLSTTPSSTVVPPTITLSGSNVANFTIQKPGLNNYTLTATYVPTSNSIYQGSVGSGGLNVGVAGSSTIVTSSSPTSTFGASVTFTATVTPSTATGTASFYDGGGTTLLGIVTLSGGKATLSTSALAVGSHRITAVYRGDANYSSSTSPIFTQTVTPAATTTGINAPAVAFGANGTVTVTVTSSVGTPTGSVTLRTAPSPTSTQTQPLSSGVAIFTITSPSMGSHSLTATYTAQGNYGASSAIGTLNVGVAGTTTSVTSSSLTSTFGTSVTFTSTVTPSTATGTVTFKDGATTLGTGGLSGGTAAFSTAALAGGPHSITAAYGGNTNFTGSTSSAITQNVNKATTTTSVPSPSPNPSAFGASVTFTATVTPSTATGSVTFKDGATVLGLPVSLSGGTATFSTAALSGGPHSITAAYSGDVSYGSSTSSVVLQTVNKAVSTTFVTSSPGPNPSVYGASVTFTATVTPSTATGTVTFSDSMAGVLGTGSLSGGLATFSSTALAVGTHTITATYNGDGNYVSSTTNFTQYVSNTTTTTSLNSNPRPSTYGTSVTFTSTVTPSGATGIVTGIVTFRDGAVILGTGTLSNGLATFVTSSLGGGLHEIYADYGGNSGYIGSTSTPLAHRVNPANQAITITTPAPANAAYNTGFTVAATAPGGAVSYSSGSPGICTNAGANFTMISGTGSCVVLYDQAGNANYNAAPRVTSSTTAK